MSAASCGNACPLLFVHLQRRFPGKAVVVLLELPFLAQGFLPALFQGRCHQAVPRIDRLIAALGQLDLVAPPAGAVAASAFRTAAARARRPHEPGDSIPGPPVPGPQELAARPGRRSPAQPSRSNAARCLPHTGDYRRTGPCPWWRKTVACAGRSFRRPTCRPAERSRFVAHPAEPGPFWFCLIRSRFFRYCSQVMYAGSRSLSRTFHCSIGTQGDSAGLR